MADDQRTTEDEVPGGGPYTAGPNKYTGGGTTVEDVSPLPGRSNAPEDADDS
jgi:hypothetical protein